MAASDAKCKGVECTNPAGTLQCPTCLKLGIKNSYFCSQDCFKRSWSDHKQVHKTASEQAQSLLRTLKDLHKPTPYPSDPATGTYDPFPNYPYTGALRPVYPLSPYRPVPDHIRRPDYAEDGIPRSEAIFSRASKIQILDEKGIEAMRLVCRLGREILDIAAAAVRPGITTDEIDEIVHKATIERNSYPSPLRYNHFPKSLCTSVNEVICHGIPDQRKLEDGDIVNIDISVYHGGYHADLNETYYVGEKAKADPDTVRVVETSRECLDKAIEIVKPGMLFREPGNVIEKHAKSRNCSVVKTYCGHGTNTLFHCAPNVPHYAKNKAVGVAKPGMCFTIEPMINLGTWRDKTWPDNWTSTTADGMKSAQFEHLLLVTEDGCDILTARKPDSPGGPVPMPEVASTSTEANGVNGSEKK
ncbi:Methionine aminopeptidase 1 [Orbilia brochopaga]|uniref:Methionine aminopeptidase n=1 Tax=Orbilia brochopaga TaxID=3140254 RepID=A0AAV9UY47_9PEZI